MEKIKVAVIGAGGKMGTRTSNNLVTKFPDKFDVKLVETFPPAVERIEKERGLKVTPVDEALAFADVVIFAVPDTLIKKLSAEYVPMLKPGTVFLILDPAAAVAKELTLRDDCTFGVAHPCHPSYFKWQKEEEAYQDRFGGEGGHHLPMFPEQSHRGGLRAGRAAAVGGIRAGERGGDSVRRGV